MITSNNIKVKVYPNPANNTLNFKFDDQKKYTITILTLIGQEVSTLSNIKSSTKIDVSNLSQGVYLFQIINTNGDKAIGKFVKE